MDEDSPHPTDRLVPQSNPNCNYYHLIDDVRLGLDSIMLVPAKMIVDSLVLKPFKEK